MQAGCLLSLPYAGVMELVDMRDLGSRAEKRVGSTPITSTNLFSSGM